MRRRLVVAVALGCLMAGMLVSSSKPQQEAKNSPAVKSACSTMDVDFSVKETNTRGEPSTNSNNETGGLTEKVMRLMGLVEWGGTPFSRFLPAKEAGRV
jgi:hypothetical protein